MDLVEEALTAVDVGYGGLPLPTDLEFGRGRTRLAQAKQPRHASDRAQECQDQVLYDLKSLLPWGAADGRC